jgi:hypothetical protein
MRLEASVSSDARVPAPELNHLTGHARGSFVSLQPARSAGVSQRRLGRRCRHNDEATAGWAGEQRLDHDEQTGAGTSTWTCAVREGRLMPKFKVSVGK